MSTRAVLARKTASGWRGVVHVYDSAPWELGNFLLIEVFARSGDLHGLVQAVVDEGPGGWESFISSKRLEGEDAPFFHPGDLRDAGWLEWFYLFDVARRRLDVFCGEAPNAQGESKARTHSLSFDARGRSEPGALRGSRGTVVRYSRSPAMGGRRRAKSVMSYLAGKGVEPGKVAAVGKGEQEPVAPNDTKAGRDQNRRIEILFATPG
jgi:hypothetical protein